MFVISHFEDSGGVGHACKTKIAKGKREGSCCWTPKWTRDSRGSIPGFGWRRNVHLQKWSILFMAAIHSLCAWIAIVNFARACWRMRLLPHNISHIYIQTWTRGDSFSSLRRSHEHRTAVLQIRACRAVFVRDLTNSYGSLADALRICAAASR